MAGLVEQLIEIIEEQNIIYEQLLDLSQQKKNVIIENNLEKLQSITDSENILVSKNNKADKKRKEIFKDISFVLNKEEDDITLSTLASLINEQEESKKLNELKNRAFSLLSELKEVNEENKDLIDYSLEHVEFSMNVMRNTLSGEPCYYDSSGQELPSYRGFFDAKQ